MIGLAALEGEGAERAGAEEGDGDPAERAEGRLHGGKMRAAQSVSTPPHNAGHAGCVGAGPPAGSARGPRVRLRVRPSNRLDRLFDHLDPRTWRRKSLSFPATASVRASPTPRFGILDAAGADIAWDTQVAGMAGVARWNDPMPEQTLDSIKRTRLALKGPLETPVGQGFRSMNVALRKTFDLYANVRPARSIIASPRGYDDLDIVLVRENTEGLYIGIEHYVPIGDDPKAAAESVALITRSGSERIVRYAFEYAVAHGRKKVTLVHKANILKFSQGLFLDVGRDDRARVRGARRVRRADRRRDGDAARPGAGAVRRHRDDESVRRHPLRSDLGARRRARARAGRQHRAERGDLRGGTRHGARTSPGRRSRTRARSCSRPA